MKGLAWGGVERWFRDVALGLRERGHSVYVAGRPDSAWIERMSALDFEATEVRLRQDFDLKQARKLSSLLREKEIDVIVTKLHRGIRASGFAAKFDRHQPVVAFMGLVETKPGLRYRLSYEMFLDRVVTLSQTMKREIVGNGRLDPRTVEVIPYGVRPEVYERPESVGLEVRQELGIPADAPVALALGRLNQQKRFDVLLDAYVALLPKLPRAHVMIAGNGSLEKELIEQRDKLGLRGRVHFLGFRRDIPELLSACDTLMLSSDDEGLPMVVLEAMAASRPVVTTEVGSVREQVESGKTGLIVPRRDPAALADALARVLTQPDRGRAMGQRARERVTRVFPLDLCVERTEAYFQSLL